MKNKDIYIGLDIGTNSVGYAVTDEEYNLVKYKGEPMWGSHVFEDASTKAKRRGFRSARRRLDRRNQRTHLTQEIFAREIANVDEKFFIRIKESGLFREDTSINSTYFLFEGDEYNDKKYHEEYPTIHHLIQSFINDRTPKDVRLVYLAIAWLMAHRGHFNSEVDKHNIANVLNFDDVYRRFQEQFETPIWECDINAFKEILLKKATVTKKENAFFGLLNGGKKFKDTEEDTVSKALIVKLLSGGSVKPEKLFFNSEYSEVEPIKLGMEEENFIRTIIQLGDDGELLLALRAIYDWGLLAEILDLKNAGDLKPEEITLSASKVKVYEQHKKDLMNLKYFVKKQGKEKYDKIFRDEDKENYASYVGHDTNKKCDKEKFSDFLKKELKGLDVATEDKEFYDDMMERLELKKFLPKQVDGDNRVIPYQLYWHELNLILKNAKEYLPFLSEKDADGYENAEKIMSIFEFKIPYFVGPLRTDNTKNGWMVRKAEGKIYPWNFDEKVDLDASEQEFINRMTNTCTYLPGEDVIPKNSLLYSKYMVLNEINNIKVNGAEIPVAVKQDIYEKFKEYKKMSVKRVKEVLKSEGCFKDGDVLSGLDESIKSSLGSYHSFKKLIESKQLTEKEVEDIISHITYSEDKMRLKKWVDEKFTKLPEEDRKYISRLKFSDFGRLSKKLLVGIEGTNKETGEVYNIIDALWNTNDNLMQILSDRYTFVEIVEAERNEYYENNSEGLDEMLDSMYISNSVKRPIYRTLAILKDVKKATKREPKRIFIEMARGGGEKGKRTKSRRNQIEDLYKNYSREEIRGLSLELDGATDNELQSETLFLYFTQLGKCMYSGEDISIDELKTNKYNVDHIYPQSLVKDDSILNNKVLVLSKLNADKGDEIINGNIRAKMGGFWKGLYEKGLIGLEKYKRLTRTSGFSDSEKQGFINRQIVETRQSTKALAEILKNMYPNTEIVYVKAGLASDFRKECIEVLKSREINDLHHGKDAYLNIVCGNVYHCRFTKNFFIDAKYSLKVKTLFGQQVKEDEKIVWHGKESIEKVKKIVIKNNLHYTRFAFERKGKLFNATIEKAGRGAVERKQGMSIEKYGGYNNMTITTFMFVKYAEKGKEEIILMPIELWASYSLNNDILKFKEYAKCNIARLLGKSEDSITIIDFPLGMRRIKINTVISFDGFKFAIKGKHDNGRLGIKSMEVLKFENEDEQYVKKLERFSEKYRDGRIKKIFEVYDKITKEKNLALYHTIMKKLLSSKYCRYFNELNKTMKEKEDVFLNLEIEKQVLVLLEFVKMLNGNDYSLNSIGIKKVWEYELISNKLSNWSKKYSDIRIIDTSPSGIYESESANLLELL